MEKELLESSYLKEVSAADFDSLMIDMEHSVLAPSELRKQAWYPQTAGIVFERKYYDGFAKTYTAAMKAAKKRGFRNISVYGWEPFPRRWYGLENFQMDPMHYEPWDLYGKSIHNDLGTDILNPSLYVYYWSAQNVGSILCNLDFNRELISTAPHPKPLRPYFWTLLHGGDANQHWWTNQPVASEESRAWTFLSMMSGIDGIDLWNWSGTGNHQIPRSITPGADIQVGETFFQLAEGSEGKKTRFNRYDIVHIASLDNSNGEVRFGRIDPNETGQDAGRKQQTLYKMRVVDLIRYLRTEAEPLSGVIEGLALAKPLEYFLSHAKPVVDVSSQKQFLESLPIVRRMKLGKFNLIATYDPAVVYGGKPRQIELSDFDGTAGHRLSIPADAQVRFWVLRHL